MTTNVGKFDRIVRLILALILVYLQWSGKVTGTLSYVLMVVALVMLATSFMKFCPLYKIIGFNSCQKSE